MTSFTEPRRRPNPWRVAGWSTAVGLLLLPLIAMQFTTEVNWTFGDFLFAAMMFGLVGLTLELVVRASPSWFYRGGVAAAVLATFLLTWSNLAVGFIGNEDNPANALFFGIPALVLLASALAGFRAGGMVWAMVLAAAAQIAIPLAIMSFGLGDPVRIRPIEFPIATGIFTALWLTSAALFRHAARER
ncbi:hypothetical protein [Sphingomonas arenae]|uniref:hypothetical protein n=1 Tax=Sphingomonas arenae TaxID=2812555 RepID=UPI001967810E|nr:hypothetical protein [Sphingomonas arenae]